MKTSFPAPGKRHRISFKPWTMGPTVIQISDVYQKNNPFITCSNTGAAGEYTGTAGTDEYTGTAGTGLPEILVLSFKIRQCRWHNKDCSLVQ